LIRRTPFCVIVCGSYRLLNSTILTHPVRAINAGRKSAFKLCEKKNHSARSVITVCEIVHNFNSNDRIMLFGCCL